MVSLEVVYIGENRVDNNHKYQYTRKIDNGASWSSFSNDLKELYSTLNKEIECIRLESE